MDIYYHRYKVLWWKTFDLSDASPHLPFQLIKMFSLHTAAKLGKDAQSSSQIQGSFQQTKLSEATVKLNVFLPQPHTDKITQTVKAECCILTASVFIWTRTITVVLPTTCTYLFKRLSTESYWLKTRRFLGKRNENPFSREISKALSTTLCNKSGFPLQM